MNHLELRRFKKIIGKTTFGIFFPNEDKKLNQKLGVGKQLDLVLVSVPEGKQTVTAGHIRNLTGWTVKKATAFVKEGNFPKVVIYNVSPYTLVVLPSKTWSIEEYITSNLVTNDNIVFEIY